MAHRSTVDQPRGFPLPFPCGWNVGWETRGQDSDDGREGTSPSAVPTCNTPFTEYYDSVPRDRTINPLDKIRLLNAHSCLPGSTKSGRSPGLPGDHRAAPDPGRPPLPLEAVVPRQQSGRRSATSQGCRAQGLGGAVVFFLEASSKEKGRPMVLMPYSLSV